MQPWMEMVTLLGGAGAFSAALGWVVKAVVQQYLAARLDTFKLELQKEAAEHSSLLQRMATEHSVRFQALHADRAVVIRGIYEHLVDLDDILRSLLSRLQHHSEPKLPDKVDLLFEKWRAFAAYYKPRRIYFDGSTCELVDLINSVVGDISINVTTYQIDPRHPTYEDDEDSRAERRELWEKARSVHRKQFVELKRRLEDEFRLLLGIGG